MLNVDYSDIEKLRSFSRDERDPVRALFARVLLEVLYELKWQENYRAEQNERG